MMHEVDIKLLPPLLQEITELIGLSATMKIVQRHGGARLWVPAKIETLSLDHHLVKLVGLDAARKLTRQFGGQDHFDIPKAKRALRAIRDGEIRQQWPQFSQRELALKYGLTERQIRTIIGFEKTPSSQMTLNFE